MSEERAPSGERGRWSSRRKMEVVLRALRGEDLDALSRELGVTAGAIAQWREQFLAGGQAAVESRPADERDDELGRLRAKVGELTMESELLRERARRAEGTAALSGGGGRGDGPGRLALHGSSLRPRSRVPGAGDPALDGLRGADASAGTRPAAEARAEDGVHRCRADRPDPRCPGAVAVRGRRVSEGLG